MFNFNKQQIIILLVISTLSIVVGYFIAYVTKPNTNSLNKPKQADLTKPNPFFQIQTAIVTNGEIATLSDNKVTIVNDKNEKAQFSLSKQLATYKPKKLGSTEASSSSDIKSIELNKKATIVLNFSNGQFEVTEISYIPQPQ